VGSGYSVGIRPRRAPRNSRGNPLGLLRAERNSTCLPSADQPTATSTPDARSDAWETPPEAWHDEDVHVAVVFPREGDPRAVRRKVRIGFPAPVRT